MGWNDALSTLTYCQQSPQLNTANEGLPQTCPTRLSVKLRCKTIQATTGHNVHSQMHNVLNDLGEGRWLQQIGLPSPGH